MSDKDKPEPTLTAARLKQLDQEAKPEPFVYVTASGHRIVFPDFYSMEAEKGETFLQDLLGTSRNDTDALKKWLSADDYEALRGERLSLRARGILSNMVFAHYEGTVGARGEGKDSGS